MEHVTEDIYEWTGNRDLTEDDLQYLAELKSHIIEVFGEPIESVQPSINQSMNKFTVNKKYSKKSATHFNTYYQNNHMIYAMNHTLPRRRNIVVGSNRIRIKRSRIHNLPMFLRDLIEKFSMRRYKKWQKKRHINVSVRMQPNRMVACRLHGQKKNISINRRKSLE